MIKRTWPTERELDAACIHEKTQDCQLVDFVTQDGRCHSFPLAQLVQCVLESNQSDGEQSDSLTDRLTIAFPTQDVVIAGWNLRQLRDVLDHGKPVLVRVRDARHAGVADGQAFVTGIAVTGAAHK